MVWTEMALGVMIAIAAWTDWQYQKISNKLLAPAFVTALILQGLLHGWSGIRSALLGTLAGLALLLIPYLLGGMGAGDVKFLAVIGSFGGAGFVVTSFLYGAILGGLIAVILLVRRRALGATFKHFLLLFPFINQKSILHEDVLAAHREKFPYGIALAAGTALAMLWPLGVL